MNDPTPVPVSGARLVAKKKPRVFETVCDDIRHQVSRGFLRPGDKLPAERELAERLGVSRAAVREALRALEASGVLEFRAGVHGGAFIREPSASGIRASVADMLALGKISLEHLSETRSSLLAFAIRLACERATDSDFRDIEDNISETESYQDGQNPTAMIDAITEFYVLIGNASHNGVLKALIEAVTDVAHELLIKSYPTSSPGIGGVRRAILKALRDRDTELAVRLMTEHMQVLHEYHLLHGGPSFLAQQRAPKPKRKPKS